MSQVKLDNVPGLFTAEPIVTDAAVSVAPSETFDTHLGRAQSQPLQEAVEAPPAEDNPRGDSDNREDIKSEETIDSSQPETVEDTQETDRSEQAETDEAETAKEENGDENGDENAQNDDKQADSDELAQVVDAVPVTTDPTSEVSGEVSEVPDETTDNAAHRELKDGAVDVTTRSKAEIVEKQSNETSDGAIEPVEVETLQDELQQKTDGERTAESGKQEGAKPQTDVESRNGAKPQAAQDSSQYQSDQTGEQTPQQTNITVATVPIVETQHLTHESAETSDNTAKPTPTVTVENQANTPTKPAAGQASQSDATQPPADGTQDVQVDRARFVQRVAKAFQAMGNRSGSVRLRLSPPELGSLRVDVSVRNGMMSAKVEAENQVTRNLLLDNLPALRDRLAQQDIKIEQFDVELTDRSHGGLPDDMAGHAESDNRGGDQTAHREAEAETDVSTSGSAINRPGEGTQLNVVI